MTEHSNRTTKVINKAGPLGFPAIMTYVSAAIYFV